MGKVKSEQGHKPSTLLRWTISPALDVLYGTLPTPTFQLPDGRLQPDFLMDTFPDVLFLAVSFAMVGGILYYFQDNASMICSAAIPVLVHWILFFGHGLPERSEKYFDLAGQLGFSAMLTYSLSTRDTPSARSNLVCLLAFLWSFRLGYFLFTRFLERGEDWRFIRAKTHVGFHCFTWTSQGMWCFFQGQAILALHHLSTENASAPPLGTLLDYVGLLVWTLGLTIETVADQQKLEFVRKHPERKNRKWIDEGIWRYSKHPNFFGETLTWVGISLICASGVGQTLPEIGRLAFAPTFSALFLMQTTVPWLDILAAQKYKGQPGWDAYSREVSNYILLPRRPAWV